MVGDQSHAPALYFLGKKPIAYGTGGYVIPRAGLYGCGKSLLLP